MLTPEAACSTHWRYADLIRCGETWVWATLGRAEGGLGQDPATFGLPKEPGSWKALSALAVHVLEPIVERWGRPSLTYGFSGPELTRLVQRRVGRVAPQLDQHASCEVGSDGRPICPRLGAAVDLFVPGLGSLELARWVVDAVDFDRLYVYGDERPVHVSHGPDQSRSITLVERRGARVLPRRLTRAALAALADRTMRS